MQPDSAKPSAPRSPASCDASADSTRTVLSRVHGIRTIHNPENLGFVGACNRGIEAAKGEYVVLLNNDTEVRHGWLDALVATADADVTVGVVGSKLVYPDGRLQEAGAATVEALPPVVAMTAEATIDTMINTIHAHPTLYEAMGEAFNAVYGRAINF